MWKVLQTRRGVLKRFGMSMEELKKELKFSCVILNGATHNLLSFSQVLYDILRTKDGSLYGPPRGPNDPQAVTVITLNPDLYYSSTHPMERIGPQGLQIMMQALFKATLGYEIEIESYGKPYKLNFDFVEEALR